MNRRWLYAQSVTEKTSKNAYAHTRQTLRIFLNHAKRYPWQAGFVIFGVVFYTLVSIYIPTLYRDIVNILSEPDGVERAERAIKIVFLILAINFARVLIWRTANFVNNFFQSKVMSDLIYTCYQYLNYHSYSFFNSKFVGSIVTKVKRYERSFEAMADQVMFDFGRTILETALILAVLLWQYRVFGYVVLAWSVVYMLFSWIFARFKLPYDLKRSQTDTRTTAQLADSITNNVNVKLFTNYDLEEARFRKTLDDQYRARRRSWDFGSWGDVVQAVAIVFMEFFAIYFAIKLWSQGQLNVGDIVLFQAYLLRIFDKFWNMGKNIKQIYEAIADANEMTEMLLEPHGIQDAPNAKDLALGKGQISFKDVTFSYYKGVPVLNKFDLDIQAGERVALIGPSGGGKTTILRLMLRFHDVDSGRISIDGQDISKITQDSLRAAVAFVPQEPILFHRSLFENIRYAKQDATDEEVFAAAKLAHAHEFITSFPEGYETLVGERGVKLSGGERQRVAIARAILKDAPILMLDEATSSLDSESEHYIQDALRTLMKGRTTIVVAHRLSTIMQMDRIIVIDHGKILEEGRHEELLKVQQGLYQRLWGIQAGGFSAA